MTTQNAKRTTSPKRLLVRGVNWLGDAVMTTPALLRLREAFPDAHISILSPEKLAELWWQHPAIDEVLSFSRTESVWKIGAQLRGQNFDAGIIFPNSPRSALELWLGRVPQRIGYKRPWRNFFLTRAIPTRTGIVEMRKRTVPEIKKLIRAKNLAAPVPIPIESHQMFHYLHLVAQLGAKADPLPPRLVVTDSEVAKLREKFGFPSTAASPLLIGINAGAEYGPAKRWPAEKFIAAAVELRQRLNCHCWIFGGPNEWEFAGDLTLKIRQASGGNERSVACLAGKTSLRELCAALRACNVLISNDSGPMHVAAAVGTPVVVPFGSTSPELTGPGLPGETRHTLIKSDAPCAPCFLRECPIDFRCLQGIAVEPVVAAAINACKKTANA